MNYEDIPVGLEVPDLAKGPMSTAHIVRWSAASENWHRIHYDWPFATAHDGLPDVLVSGSWKQHVLIELLTRWIGESGWLYRIKFQFRGMTAAGATLRAWARVTSREKRGAYGLLHLDIGMKDQDDVESTPGSAVVVVQRSGGPGVPHPFDPALLDN